MRYFLYRDNKLMFFGTELECVEYIHRHHCYSIDHALKHEGYSLVCKK